MRHLSLFFFVIFAAGSTVHGQNGYSYDRPNNPLGSGPSTARPSYQDSTSSYPGFSSPSGPSTPSYSSPSFGGSSPSSGYPSGRPQNQFGSQSDSQGNRPQSGYTPGPSISNTGYPQGNSQYPQNGQRPTGQGTLGQQRPTSTYPQSSGYPSGPANQNDYSPAPQRPSNLYPQADTNGYQQGSGPSGRPSTSGSSSNYPQGGSGFGGQQTSNQGNDDGSYDGGDYSAIPGEPDKDYPILSEIPQTSFRCDEQQYPGYYADVETRCQVFHVCANNKTYDFLCPNGTIYSQEFFVCVWWNQFDCNSAPSFFGLNANLYDNSITGSQQGNTYPNSQGQQGGSYTAPSGPQGPSAGYQPGQFGSQGPTGTSGGYPSSQRPQGSGSTYPSSQSPSSDYPTGSTVPSGTYPGSRPSTSYLGSQAPSSKYPVTGPQSSYPGQGPTSYPTSQAPQGYPSGAPSGPSFPSGPGTSRPSGFQSSQNDNGFSGSPPKPDRGYLPPRN